MEAQHKQTNSGSDDTILIAVMGCTGSGKSSFIKLISGDNNVETGNGLQSMTSKVQRFDFTNSKSGRKVTIVDTPGFDDSEVSDTEILKRITNFLLEEYDAKRKLNGLVYLHRISDPRFGGQSKRNLRMFKELCGTDTYKSVVILTTFWDRVGSYQEGEMRELELKSNFFQRLVQEGATFMQHDRTLDSAQRVLNHIFTLAPVNVRITEEIREEGKTLEQTAAGSVRREEVDLLISQHKEEIAGFQAEMDALKGSNEKLRQELTKNKAEMQKKVMKLEEDRAGLLEGLATEKNERQKLQTTIEQQQWRAQQEHDNLMRGLEAERAARQNLEEQERQLQVELERQRQLELARQQQLEQERQRRLEVARQQQLEQERQRQLELARQKELELERQWQLELELEQLEQELEQLELEQQQRLELERQWQLELEQQWELELEQQRQRELELERQCRDQARIRELQHQLREADDDDSGCIII